MKLIWNKAERIDGFEDPSGRFTISRKYFGGKTMEGEKCFLGDMGAENSGHIFVGRFFDSIALAKEEAEKRSKE